MFKNYNWPVIYVVLKSVEKKTAPIIRIFNIKKG